MLVSKISSAEYVWATKNAFSSFASDFLMQTCFVKYGTLNEGIKINV